MTNQTAAKADLDIAIANLVKAEAIHRMAGKGPLAADTDRGIRERAEAVYAALDIYVTAAADLVRETAGG